MLAPPWRRDSCPGGPRRCPSAPLAGGGRSQRVARDVLAREEHLAEELGHLRDRHPAALAHAPEQVAREGPVRLQRHVAQDQLERLHRPVGEVHLAPDVAGERPTLYVEVVAHHRAIRAAVLPRHDGVHPLPEALAPVRDALADQEDGPGHRRLEGGRRGGELEEVPLPEADHHGRADGRPLPARPDLIERRDAPLLDREGRLRQQRPRRRPGAPVRLRRPHVGDDLRHDVDVELAPELLRALPELDDLVVCGAQLPLAVDLADQDQLSRAALQVDQQLRLVEAGLPPRALHGVHAPELHDVLLRRPRGQQVRGVRGVPGHAARRRQHYEDVPHEAAGVAELGEAPGPPDDDHVAGGQHQLQRVAP
mmetsp:Transcript_97958/g.277662  ORF Transcript_97958/g.277662 Transcript_97958/m.277662 type:complete len:366 (+) Transcript_97958:193-1290(+)